MSDQIYNNWQSKAACKGKDIAWFFEAYEKSNVIQLEVQKICASCPVRKECNDFAIQQKVEGGVFGGRWYEVKKVPQKRKVNHDRIC